MIAAGFLRNAENVTTPDKADLILDDIIDSGRTRCRYAAQYPTTPFAALVDKIGADKELGWVVFPWEAQQAEDSPHDAVERLLQFIGEDIRRPGLADTPQRVCKALAEMTTGYKDDPAAILSRTFPDAADEMVVLSGVQFFSLCEHHLLPFEGTATVGYVPTQRVVGISKLARLVHCYARRLQVQERMTREIADAIMQHLQPLGCGVIIRARHLCMACRGIREKNTEMITSATLGLFRDDAKARAEFLSLAHAG
jgi:GTP cyclohydrolase I